MEEREVRLVHEEAGWQIYVDDAKAMGGWFAHKDKVIAELEAKKLARKNSPCILTMINSIGDEYCFKRYSI